MLDTLSDEDRTLMVLALAHYSVDATTQHDKRHCRALLTRLLGARTVVLPDAVNPIVEQ